MRAISSILGEASRGWVSLLALVVFLAFGALVLPREAQRAEETSGGAGSPDTNLFYNAQDLYSIAEAYGPEGREAYVRARYTFDVVFPLIYGFFLATSISWFSKRTIPSSSSLRFLNLIPVTGVIFDFLENLATSVVMLRYPKPTQVVVQLAPVLSLIKWIFVYGSFIVLGLLIAVWLIHVFRRRRDRNI